jgi:integrase
MGCGTKPMARHSNKLSNPSLNKLPDGLHADGANLYFRVRDGSRSWAFRYTLDGKSREAGLGKWPERTLQEARAKAFEWRRKLIDGIDPLAERIVAKAAAVVSAAKAETFGECFKEYVQTFQAGWKPKQIKQWTQSMEDYTLPVIGSLPVASIDTALVMKVLEPIWTKTPETANRVRQRTEKVLAWATVHELRSGPNPAQWDNHLDQLLPKRGDLRKVVSHAAMPYADLGEFVTKLRALDSIAGAPLEFLILTAARTNEVMGARWSEIDLEAATWTVPAERMKAGEIHRVPLSPRALELLRSVPQTGSPFVFTGRDSKSRLGNSVFRQTMQRLAKGYAVHGFRSTFKDWARERTNFPDDISEAALAHKVDDKVKAAYQRTDFFDKRRQLMRVWAEFLAKPPAVNGDKVVALRAG